MNHMGARQSKGKTKLYAPLLLFGACKAGYLKSINYTEFTYPYVLISVGHAGVNRNANWNFCVLCLVNETARRMLCH